jgi:hypothetical protein
MAEADTTPRRGGHWMALEGGREGSPPGRGYRSRFTAIGACIPAPLLTTDELMASTRYETGIELERLTGVRERHVVGEGEKTPTRLRSGPHVTPWRARTLRLRISTC